MQDLLRFIKGSMQTKGEHDGMVTAGTAFTCEDVIYNGGMKTTGSDYLCAPHSSLVEQTVEILPKRAFDRRPMLKIVVRGSSAAQPLKQFLSGQPVCHNPPLTSA